MKRNVLMGLLGIEALLCVVLSILQASLTSVFSSVLAFPFEQIAGGLRWLSLSGGVGNAVAVLLYIAVSLLPVAALLVLWYKRERRAENGLLALLSAVLFAVMYLMINPGLIDTPAGGTMGQSVGKAILGGMIYSVLCGYLVLRVLRLFVVGEADQLVRYLSVMLSLLNVFFVYAVFGAGLDSLLQALASLRIGNVGHEQLLGASYLFLILRFMADALPNVLDVWVVFAALRLLREMRSDRYSAGTVGAAERMSRLCVAALTVTVLSNIGFNLLQLLFVKSLMVVNSSVQIPLFSITFVLAALLLTRFAAENKRLKDDNDRFI
ncbi:MAG: hypothetical protein LBT32_01620 [Peptococcaceae bacterium]|jgi:hypothetical protein|nr:hypothetical protein [Peptococcaceae bacterium]